MKYTVLVIAIFMSLNRLAYASELSGGQEKVVINTEAVGMPINKLLLIRDKHKYCAVKFVSAIKGKAEGEGYAKYEAVFLDDGRRNLKTYKIKVSKGELADLNPVGIGRFALTKGNTNIYCDGNVYSWSGSGSLNWTYFSASNIYIDIAPTKWTDFSEVNVFDKRLKWYKKDEKRLEIVTSVNKLW